MDFNIPQGGSQIAHFDVTPVEPVGGVAQPWKVVLTSEGAPQEVDSFDIVFKLASTPQQRQYERMIMVFSIAETAQTPESSWRFSQDGVIYCEGGGDYLDDISLSMSDNCQVVTATVKCLTDVSEDFKFSFVALKKNNASGECQIYASEDPGGSVNRRQ